MADSHHTQAPGASPGNPTTPLPISNELLRRYLASREKIDRNLDFISVFTGILSQYKECDGDELLVDLYAIGYVNEMLRLKALDVIDALDDFILLGEAMGAVMEEDNVGG